MIAYISIVLFSILLGNFIYDKCRNIVDKDQDKVKDFKLNKLTIIGAVALFAIALYYKSGILGLCAYGGVGTILISIGIIDYYTRYVYLKMAILGIGYSLVFGIGINGISELKYIVCIAAIFVIIAKNTGEWYGDIEALLIVAFSVGIPGLLMTFILIGIQSIIVAIKKKTIHCIVPLCPMIAIGYIATVLIFL